jgi:sortase (surface protein transpeptidase)
MAHRVRLSTRLAGEIALIVALTGALAFSWSDGTPPRDAFNLPFTDAAWIQDMSNSSLAGSQPNVVFPALPQPSAPPVQLLIPSLDVHRAVEQVTTNRAGVLNLPVNAWDAGWYNGGPVPGAPGDAVIEGHAGYPGQPMIFGKLVKLHPGDKIVVVLADHSRQLFLVDSMTIIPVGTAPAGMGEPYGPPRLTLITCTGHFDKNSYSYSSRLVLEASYAGVV